MMDEPILAVARHAGLSAERAAHEQRRGLRATPAAPAHRRRSAADPTVKEERILQLIAEGKSNKQIYAAVFLAEGTAKNYASRVMDKLHARSRTELAVCALGRPGVRG